MKKFYPIIIILFFALGSVLLFSCGDISSDESGKTLTQINISPTSATLTVGTTESFSVIANYSNGTSASVTPTWSLSSAIGTITSVGFTGLFTATAEGTGTLTATYNSKTASATIIVTGEATTSTTEVTTIEVSPSTDTLRVGETQTFTAAGINISGESLTISPSWEISGEAIGVFTFYETIATLEVTAEGFATIICTSGEVSAYSYVTAEGYTATITVETDTYVDQANSSEAYGTATSLKAGYVSTTAKYYETYLYFSLASIPSGATIESVTLKIYPSTAGSSSLQLKELASSFANSTSWEAKPSVGSYLLASTLSSGSYNSLSGEDFTTLVNNWHNDPTTYPNYGLAIVQEGTEDGTVVLLSKEDGSSPPALVINYTR